ncbi:glutamine synthetase III [Erysipelothrix aquatica]|uniref:glutamine synthetase III n=1 Tax=Erysipelothrix aquatica TaxID=2683714 RepID=UPI00135CBFC0|nr:glutamine synthetase III [Erysipelothrix aquatica]
MTNIMENFGTKLFSSEKMRKYMPRPVFLKWERSVSQEEPMDRETADAIAHAMKVWAMENGATHYSHWFHPMTGSSAEKHDAFIEVTPSGETITRFSGKNLIKGETDGSSFPNGGLRQTFEARGYTYWDVTSPAFLRGHVLFIPSIFIAYHGESLDEKAPLIKAMDALSEQATRVVHALGDKSVTSVRAMVGLEQEYFLVNSETFQGRDDLKFTGRTLLGHEIPKDQEHVGHYFGAIPAKVIDYMEAVNEELWKLGIHAKVEHNEVSPAQFEIVVIYAEANIAIDQNMLVMETLERVALKHNMNALLHEKPFAKVNGSGKHNNFSLVTDTGLNLFDPGDRPHENVRFLIFVSAMIRAVDTHAELLRFAASTPGNDYRLGASEAPPAIISMFVGQTLESILNQLMQTKELTLNKDDQYFSPLASLSATRKDGADRNRTSPFAFTGNKFEFRMPGSAICSAFVNTVLCAILAESLELVADELEQYKYVQESRERALEVCQEIVQAHHRILFSGDGYHESWVEEASRRGLANVTTYLESTHSLLLDKSQNMFEKTRVLNRRELEARYEIARHRYVEDVRTEALTLIQMINRQLLPAAMKQIHALMLPNGTILPGNYAATRHAQIVNLSDRIVEKIQAMEQLVQGVVNKDLDAQCLVLDREVVKLLASIRVDADQLETYMDASLYPFPTYSDLLFHV